MIAYFGVMDSGQPLRGFRNDCGGSRVTNFGVMAGLAPAIPIEGHRAILIGVSGTRAPHADPVDDGCMRGALVLCPNSRSHRYCATLVS